MPTDYAALQANRDYKGELQRAHGLISDLYSEPAHFVIELLQNAEDALGKRPDAWNGDRTVSFVVGDDFIEVAHYGRPFDRHDVDGIVITLSSTKADTLNDIGKFGIGFRSVFAITERPCIYSEDERFAIENYIDPVEIPALPDISPELTLFRLPLNDSGLESRQAVIDRLAGLDLRTLLFLRHIDGVVWRTDAGQNGRIHRQTESGGDGVRLATITRENGAGEVDESERWVVFSRPVSHDGKPAGSVEMAFRFADDKDDKLQPIADSVLTVFFPTKVETHLGFLLHGPYRTTPSRETVSETDHWNQALIRETAALIPDVLRWLKDRNLLTAEILDRFPIRASFAKHDRFSPLYDATKAALASRPLLPCSNGSYHPASKTRLGSTDAIRQLFLPRQLAQIYGEAGHLFWISGDITENLFGELRRYIRDELDVTDLTPDGLIPLLRNGRAFLESQSDKWVSRLYEFLAHQPALHERLLDVPLLRLDDGRHIAMSGEIKAFLPGKSSTAAPTIRKSVCATSASLQFLQALGLSEREPVDDVIESVLPKYQADPPDAADYDADLHRIISAYKEVSNARKDEFLAEISEVNFVKAIDAATGSEQFVTPKAVYLADDEQRRLFAGVSGVLFTSSAHDVLNTSDALKMLAECRATPSDDMADIVIDYVLPKYLGGQAKVNAIAYTRDIKRIVTAYEKIPNERRRYLVNSLRTANFVRSIDTGNGTKQWGSPASLYLATTQLQELFEGVPGVRIVDATQSCLRSGGITRLLEACGASSRLVRVRVANSRTPDDLRSIRRNAGLENSTWNDPIIDRTFRGLTQLINMLPQLPADVQLRKSTLLWRSLADLAEHSGHSAFRTVYRWGYSHETKTAYLDDFGVKRLNNSAWIPDENGQLQMPNMVYFNTVQELYGWENEPVLESKIQFKPPAISELSRLTGIDEDALDLVQRHGLTAEDIKKFVQKEALEQGVNQTPGSSPMPQSTPAPGSASATGSAAPPTPHTTSAPTVAGPTASGSAQPGSTTRSFVSYIATHPDGVDADSDPDGLEHAARMSLEAKAIDFILSLEPNWHRTAPNNPGYDLYQVGDNEQPMAWCEVKAMGGTFANRPATLTNRQFEEAQGRGKAYWLYVVENAASDIPTLVKINDPAGHASTFTFDKGWLEIAEIVQ